MGVFRRSLEVEVDKCTCQTAHFGDVFILMGFLLWHKFRAVLERECFRGLFVGERACFALCVDRAIKFYLLGEFRKIFRA